MRTSSVKAEDVLRSIELQAPSEGLPIIGPAKGAILDGVIRKHRPSRILEIGTLVGYSAIRMARLLPEGGKLTCVEVNGDLAAIARSNLTKAGVDERVEILVGDAKKVVPGIQGSVDLVLVDAVKTEYLAYLKAAEHLLHPGSVVVADNIKIFADEVAGFLDYVRNSGRYRSSQVEAPLNADRSSTDAMEISVMI